MNAPAEDTVEDVEVFRLRARAWIEANMGPVDTLDLRHECETDEQELAAVARDRAIQRKLFDGGFAGLCIPQAYGGQGLTPAHQAAFNEELAGHEYPSRFTVPTMNPCCSVLLEFGSEEIKRRHIPAILKGEEIWCQLLSEPGGGSDVAGATTTAVRDGDDWILNGSKVWTSGAWWGDWAICLARTNWDVSKHQGLTVFILPLTAQGLEIRRIERLDGSREFCQEFLSDVRVPDSDRMGDVNEGWVIGSRWMYHERVGHNSPLVTQPAGLPRTRTRGSSLADVVEEAGALDDPRVRDLVGQSRVLDIVGRELLGRLASPDPSGRLNEHAAAIGRLFMGEALARRYTIAFEVAGDRAAAWAEGEPSAGVGMPFLIRQAASIGGGTTEISRNVIAERVLGMPREPSLDRNVAFRNVPRGVNRAG